MTEDLPPVPNHPESRIMFWGRREREIIEAYGRACAAHALLAAPQPAQQGVVAWMYQCTADNSGPALTQRKQDWAESGSGLWKETPLYATPQAQPAQPLSDERILHIQDTHVGGPTPAIPLDASDWINFARAIEAAHNIKGTT